MMGMTHAASGMLAGLVLAPVVGLHGMAEIAPFAVTCAGYALAPDLDHPSSTVTRKFGPITRLLSMGLRGLSAMLYRATKGPRDEAVTGKHRHATHTAIFAGLLGVLCSVSSDAWGAAAVAVWLGLGLLLAYDRLGVLVVIPLALGAAAWLVDVDGRAAGAAGALEQCAGWLGIAVAAGAFVHCLGDALTESGCPFLFPIPIAGETWYELRPPAWLRFQTGKGFERFVMFPVLMAGCVAAAPGAWPHLVAVAHWSVTR